MKNITAVILAAGLGTRMKTDLPKVLHPVGSGTILGKVISSLKKAGVGDIIAVVGYKAELVESSFKDKVKFVRQEELLGSGDALKCALGAIKKDTTIVLVTCGDAPLITEETYKGIIKTHEEEEADSTLLTCRVDEPASYGRIVRGPGGEILKIVEEKDASAEEKRINEINVGTYCFEKDLLEKYIHDIEINKKKKEFYLTDIIDIFVRNKKCIASVACQPDEAIGINTRKDLALVNKLANMKKIEKLMEEGVTVIDPETTYIDEDASVGKDTVIFPSTVIEGSVKIGARCKIGPFARIRPGTVLDDEVTIGNFVEINRTKIGTGTRVKHHTYLGDALVGKDVNIGAGTITANYDGKSKHTTVIEDEASVGVGVVFIAPVKIGKSSTIGAGSVVTKNKDVPPGETVAGIPAKPLKK